MKKKITKSLIAVAGIASAFLLAGCEKDEPVQALYGVPANITVENSNSYYLQFEGEDKTAEDIKKLIKRIEFDNNTDGGKTESTMTTDITYPIIKYEGPKAEELDENFSYKVEIKDYNDSGFVSRIKVTEY